MPGWGRAAGWLQRGCYLGKSVQAGVAGHHHCSEQVPVFHLKMHIFRNIHPGGGYCREWETLVGSAVVLEPLGHSPGFVLGLEPYVPIQMNYFSALLAGLSEFLGGDHAVPVI